MIINGEKYACEACVRGHRVSSCSHSERQLLHVAKKGRPVSQCPHCRSLRKNRSQHVKCECHDKSHAKEDCPHLKDSQFESQGESPPGTCCCGHGARCMCSLKKELYLDTVPEDISQILHQQKETARPRGPNVNNHDSKPTVFANGHHKPVHKFNDAHNHCGAPYRIPSRSNSHHGHREIAQRSSDSLPLSGRAAVHHESPLHNVLTASQPPRQARSEHNSPMIAPTSNPGIPPFQVEIPPLDPNAYAYSPFDAQSPGLQPGPHLPDQIPEDWFVTHHHAQTLGPPSVPELADIDWTKYGFGGTPQLGSPANMKTIYAGLASSQVPSYATSLEHLNHLNGSGFNTSSGDVSQVDDLPSNFRPSTFRSISHISNDQSSTGATEEEQSHRLSTASSYFGTPAGNALAENLEDLDIDKFISAHSQRNVPPGNQLAPFTSQSITPELQQQQFFQQPQQYQQPVQQPTPPQSQHTVSTPPESIRGFSITSHPSPPDLTDITAPYSIKEAQAKAHRTASQEMQQAEQPNMQSSAETFADPVWFQADVDIYGNPGQYTLDDEREDEQWAR